VPLTIYRQAGIPAKNCNSARNGRETAIPSYTILVCSGPGWSLQVEKQYGDPQKGIDRFYARVQTQLK